MKLLLSKPSYTNENKKNIRHSVLPNTQPKYSSLLDMLKPQKMSESTSEEKKLSEFQIEPRFNISLSFYVFLLFYL